MSDAHGRSDNEREETETEGEALEAETEVEELEPEAPDESEAELSEGEPSDDSDTNNEQRRDARGQPSREHRDRRIRERDELNRLVEREVEKRMGRQAPHQQVDPLAQRRELEQRRNQELDTARLEGPERYAETLSRHTREDLEARANSFGIQQLDDRNQRAFDRLCVKNPVYDKIRDDVERRVDELRARGVAVPDREIIAKVILGERYADRATRQGNQQRTRADSEMRRQTVRNPSSTAGQHSEPRRRGTARTFAEKSLAEMEAELSNIPVRST